MNWEDGQKFIWMRILPGEQQLYVTTAPTHMSARQRIHAQPASQCWVMHDHGAKMVPELQKALCWMLLAAPLRTGAERLQRALLYPLPTPAMAMMSEVACMAEVRGRHP